MPKMNNRCVPVESFVSGIKNKIITYIKCLPKPVYELCEKQYNNNLITGGIKPTNTTKLHPKFYK